VVAENSTREPHRLVASSIGVAIPSDRNTYGYLSEHHSFGETEEQAGEYAEELAAEMLATTLDVEFDPDKSWDEKKEIYRISNKIVRTANVTQSAIGDKRGRWTTVIAAAILSPLAYFLVLTAITLSGVAYVAPTREIGMVFGVLLGWHSLKEGHAANRLLGSALIVAGVFGLALSP